MSSNSKQSKVIASQAKRNEANTHQANSINDANDATSSQAKQGKLAEDDDDPLAPGQGDRKHDFNAAPTVDGRPTAPTPAVCYCRGKEDLLLRPQPLDDDDDDDDHHHHHYIEREREKKKMCIHSLSLSLNFFGQARGRRKAN